MLRNYFKTAWRNIVKTIGYSGLNVLGLAIGMAVALLIGLWVYYQYSFDKFLPEYQSVYRVQRNFNSNGDTLTFQTTSARLADALRNQVPEIACVALSDWGGSHGLIADNKKLYERGIIADTDFFKIFQFPVKKGNLAAAFREARSIVLTESIAKALFGNGDPLDKMVRFDNRDNLKVTAVVGDVPHNSTIDFTYVVPSTYIEQVYPGAYDKTSFGNNSYQIFVKLKPRISYPQVASKIRNIEHGETGNINATDSYVTLQPLSRWHLYSHYVNGQDTAGFLEYVEMFSIIGLLVLVIACINFVNLTTARSEKRAREVGVRKAIGSRRKDLIIQFLSEALLFTTIAFVLSLFIAQGALPAFNALTGNDIKIPFTNAYFWLVLAGCLVVTTLLAGSRPAFYLSSFNPVQVLKGAAQAGKASLSRKVLVVIQFTCSIALIISSVIVYRQIQHAKNRPTGYSLSRLMSTEMNDDLSKNFTALKNELIEKGIVSSITSATSPATDVWWHTNIKQWPGKQAGETVEMGCMFVTSDYFKTLGMRMQDGRNFSGPYDSTSVIFNEAAVKRLRLKDPVGQKIIADFNDKSYTVAGVVKDALMISPFKPADPTMFYCSNDPQNIILYRLSSQISTHDAVTKLNAIFDKYDPAYPYSYAFTDAEYASKFQLEILIGKLAGIFAALAIIISCLGLFGLAAYVAEQRTKEIGIRKVLGASVQQVWLLISRDFIVLVLISCFIAAPLSFYFLHKWLLHYDYRIDMGVGVFVLGGLMALLIAIITVSFQAIKAAIANPVRSLRTE